MKRILLNSVYLLILLFWSFVVAWVYSMDKDRYWLNFFNDYTLQVTIVWFVATMCYNLLSYKLLDILYKPRSINLGLAISSLLPILIIFFWQWQKIFYQNLEGSSFLVFHPAFIISILLYFIYTFFSLFTVILNLFKEN